MCVGSFLNVVVYRLPIMLQREWRQQCTELLADSEPDNDVTKSQNAHERFDLIAPRSACPECKTPIKALHNIPVLSYLVLRGRCAACVSVSKISPWWW